MNADKKLTNLAGAIALEAPLKQNSRRARIDWDLIWKVRARLEEVGIDWRAMHKAVTEARQAAIRRYREERARFEEEHRRD